MASKRETIDGVLSLLAPLNVRARPMFGEFILYCDDKVVGSVCDDLLFIKPTSVDDPQLRAATLAPPYPGAKEQYRFAPAELTDDDWLRSVVQATANVVPARKPRTKRGPNRRGSSRP